MGGRGGGSGMGVVTAVHLTPASNISSILRNGFDLSRAGDEGGDNWGSAVYFSTERREGNFYANRLGSSEGITADIDTSGMLRISFDGKVGSPNRMYDLAADQLPSSLKSEYEAAVKTTTRRKALSKVVSNHYTGMVIRQTGVNEVDGTTGGNQIVVYDTGVIRNLRRKRR